MALRPQIFDPELENWRYARFHAGCLTLAGVGLGLAVIIAISAADSTLPLLMAFSPIMICLGLAGLIDPRVLDAVTGRRGTSWPVYLLAVAAGFGGLAIGVGAVFYYSGLF